MARGFSKAIIVGNLTRDPELRSTPSGAQVCGFSVAVNRKFKDQEEVSFFNCNAWGKLGETIAQYGRKGSGILVSGRLDQRSYDDKNGQRRSVVEINVDDFNFIGGRSDGDSYGGGNSAGSASVSATAEAAPSDMSDDEINLDEIPF